MAGLDQRGVLGTFGGCDAGYAFEKLTNRYRVGGVVGALIDHLQHIIFADNAGSKLNPAGSPAVGHRHLATAEGYLVAGDGYRFQDGAADHAFGLLVEVGKVVAGQCVSHVDSPVAGV